MLSNETASSLRRSIELDYAISDRCAQKSFRGYLDRVVINSHPTPRRFGDIAEPWQWDRVAAIEGALEYVAGLRDSYSGPRNIWLGYSKGHDKTSFIARVFNWLLGYSKKRLKMFAASGDWEQAALIRKAMEEERALNPFLKPRVQILTKAAWGRGGTLEILASDANSGQGKTPSCVVYDELSHWGDRGRAFFDAIYSAKNKRPDCLSIVLTNAGWTNSWAYELREIARTSPSWHFFEQPVGVQLASWMDEKAILEDSAMLLPTEFRRLIRNEWIDLSQENPFVTRDEVDRCVDPSLSKRSGGDRNVKRYGAVDYGPKKDRTAICVLHREHSGRLVVDALLCWHRPGGTVLVDEVDAAVDHLNAKFNGSISWTIDPYQMEATIQRLEAKRIDVTRFAPRGGAANYELAANLRTHIVNAKIAWYPNCGPVTLPHKLTDPPFAIDSLAGDTLETELSSLIIRATPSGYRFDHTSNRHDDRCVCAGMAALAAVADPLPPPPLPAPISLPSPQRDLTQLPFAKQRGLFGVEK